MLFGNSLSGSALATDVGAGSVHSQICPTHSHNVCQRIFVPRTHFVKGVQI